MWTYQDHGTGMQRQLDYILIRKKWRKSILNAKSYSTFSSIGSDHGAISVEVPLGLRAFVEDQI